MEKRAIIALALSFLIFIAFMYFGEKQRPPAPPATTADKAPAKPEAPAPPPPGAAKPALPTPPPAPAPARPAKDVVVDTPLFRAVFTELGGRLKSFQLKKYRQELQFSSIYSFKLWAVELDVNRYQDNSKGAKLKELVRPGKNQELPLSLGWSGKNLTVPPLLPYEASQTEVTVKPGETGTLKFTGVSPEGVAFTKTFTFRADSYAFDLAVNVTNQTGGVLDGHLDLDLSENYTGEDASKYLFLGFNGSINNRLEELKSGGLKELKTFTGKIDWATLDEGYFLTALVPTAAPKAILTVSETLPGPMVATLRAPVEGLAPGQAAQLAYTLYYGPKDLDDLKILNVGLERTVNFGWFDILGKPFLYTLNFFNRYLHNYGWSIIILTILIRVLFFYPNHKSYKSMKEMQKLQPKVAKLREKYKDDRETMNKELMGLYRTFKVNPLGGCLPMVLQLPVFVALYNVLGYAIELRHAPFLPTIPFTNIVWLIDLSAKDPLLITPLIMGASMVIQQRMTPSPGDPTQAKMMMFLPIVFTFLFLNFASGLVLYWLVNNVLSIIQQHYTNKYLA
ncbi:MAG: membrane protein insertase YidC [Deltaproteobacteria bacterium]|nr:membrane protein insertase YidC [Deltaproteobacteria bacterium]